MEIVRKILSKYFILTETLTALSIPCPFCRKEGKEKQLYFYRDSGRVICFRCKGVKHRTWHNAWAALQDILGALGVDKGKIMSMHKGIQYVELGTPVLANLTSYKQREFIPGYQSPEVIQFLKGRQYTLEKVLPFFWYGTKGDLKDRICVPLSPRGWQGRVLTPDGNPKYKTVRGNASDNNLYFTPLEGKTSERFFLVESPFGAIRLFEYGYDAVAFLGTNPGKPINALLRRKKTQDVFLWMDPDVPRERLLEIAKHFISEDYALFIVPYRLEPDEVLSQAEMQEAISMAEEVELDDLFH